ncbi:MAG TPA: GlsB/YeaQ/YmgE family stress response membrane protein [Candidatus Binataceae bacterium]
MLGFIVVGLISGWLAGHIIRSEGYGIIADILLGMIGGVIGGWMFAVFGIHAYRPLGAIVIATIGASALVYATRALKGEI